MDDASELIERLLTIAGIIMEDASPDAIINNDAISISTRISNAETVGRDIQTLAAAADVLRRHGG